MHSEAGKTPWRRVHARIRQPYWHDARAIDEGVSARSRQDGRHQEASEAMNDRSNNTMRDKRQDQMPWQAYERAKREWLDQHPSASTEEIEEAMRKIAEEMGI